MGCDRVGGIFNANFIVRMSIDGVEESSWQINFLGETTDWQQKTGTAEVCLGETTDWQQETGTAEVCY